MPKKFVGTRVFGADSSDRLFLQKVRPWQATVIYQPAKEKLAESEEYESEKRHTRAKRKLLEIDGRKHRLTIFPLITIPQHPNFLEPKYDRIESIALDGWGYEIPEIRRGNRGLLQELPAGVINTRFMGSS